MKRSQPKKAGPKETVSLRVSPEFMREIHEFVLDYNTAHFEPGFRMGEPEVVTDSLAMRWAMRAGLPELRRQLQEYTKQRGNK
jgi:hypothetical protein